MRRETGVQFLLEVSIMKKKKFCRMFQPGMYVYLEFMDSKSYKSRWFQSKDRDLTPMPFLGRVTSKNRVTLLYKKEEDKYIKIGSIYTDESWNLNHLTYHTIKNPIIDIYQIWSRIQRDEIRNVRVMDRQTFLQEFFIDLFKGF